MQLSTSNPTIHFSQWVRWSLQQIALWSNSLENLLKSFIIILNPEAEKLEECYFKMSRSDKREQQIIKDKWYWNTSCYKLEDIIFYYFTYSTKLLHHISSSALRILATVYVC